MSGAVELGLARTDEAGFIAGMSRDLIETDLPWRWRPFCIRESIRDPDTLVVVARHRGVVVGFALMEFQLEEAHLNLFAVNPQWQRQGVGGRLLDWLEESARVAGIARILLEVRLHNNVARRFYQRWGYQDTQFLHRYYNGVEPALRMVRTLRATSGTT